MNKEDNKIISIVKKPPTTSAPSPQTRHLYTDAERQLFNASLSVYQFLDEARKDEAKSVNARKRCRKLLEAGKILDARNAAMEALEARGRAFACSAVAKRIDWLVEKLNDDGLKPEIETALNALDSAVLSNDLWKAKRVINTIMTEIERVEAPEIPESPSDKEVTQYLKQLKEEIAILNRLKLDNKAEEDADYCFVNQDFGPGSDASSMMSSASKITNQSKPKRTRKRYKVTERSIYE